MVPQLELIKKFYGFLQIKIKNIHFIVYGYEANGFWFFIHSMTESIHISCPSQKFNDVFAICIDIKEQNSYVGSAMKYIRMPLFHYSYKI